MYDTHKNNNNKNREQKKYTQREKNANKIYIKIIIE